VTEKFRVGRNGASPSQNIDEPWYSNQPNTFHVKNSNISGSNPNPAQVFGFYGSKFKAFGVEENVDPYAPAWAMSSAGLSGSAFANYADIWQLGRTDPNSGKGEGIWCGVDFWPTPAPIGGNATLVFNMQGLDPNNGNHPFIGNAWRGSPSTPVPDAQSYQLGSYTKYQQGNISDFNIRNRERANQWTADMTGYSYRYTISGYEAWRRESKYAFGFGAGGGRHLNLKHHSPSPAQAVYVADLYKVSVASGNRQTVPYHPGNTWYEWSTSANNQQKWLGASHVWTYPNNYFNTNQQYLPLNHFSQSDQYSENDLAPAPAFGIRAAKWRTLGQITAGDVFGYQPTNQDFGLYYDYSMNQAYAGLSRQGFTINEPEAPGMGNVVNAVGIPPNAYYGNQPLSQAWASSPGIGFNGVWQFNASIPVTNNKDPDSSWWFTTQVTALNENKYQTYKSADANSNFVNGPSVTSEKQAGNMHPQMNWFQAPRSPAFLPFPYNYQIGFGSPNSMWDTHFQQNQQDNVAGGVKNYPVPVNDYYFNYNSAPDAAGGTSTQPVDSSAYRISNLTLAQYRAQNQGLTLNIGLPPSQWKQATGSPAFGNPNVSVTNNDPTYTRQWRTINTYMSSNYSLNGNASNVNGATFAFINNNFNWSAYGFPTSPDQLIMYVHHQNDGNAANNPNPPSPYGPGQPGNPAAPGYTQHAEAVVFESPTKFSMWHFYGQDSAPTAFNTPDIWAFPNGQISAPIVKQNFIFEVNVEIDPDTGEIYRNNVQASPSANKEVIVPLLLDDSDNILMGFKTIE